MNYQRQNYMVNLFKAIGNASRVRILELLIASKEAMTVNQIAFELKLDQGNVSNHLIRMRKDGFLKARQASTNMYYSIKDANISKVIDAIG